jgi:prepilin-type processing-associated H-X9-DG protein
MDNYAFAQRTASQTPNFYYYSYTMNDFENAAKQVAGCGSTYVNSLNFGNFTATKLTNIRRASDKIMLAEEPVSLQDIPAGYSQTAISDADDARWLPGAGAGAGKPSPWGGNTITTRHNKRGNANFADGHAQIVDHVFASDPNHFDTTY